MAKPNQPVATVEQSGQSCRMSGTWKDRGRVAVFKGVPFAAPPVGEFRWRPPQPTVPWSGIREAKKDGPMAIQRAADLERFMHELLVGQGWGKARVGAIKSMLKYAPQPEQSEDCLYLSVRSPDLGPSARLPVMVWIHGGDHQDGSGSDVYYNATALAARGVVTVNINYRLGVMGYLAHPELAAESERETGRAVAGNYGTLDQIAALQWVRDNISSFGGDPDNVTIFGESAGGESVMHLMSSPAARGLFHRAVAQSPANGGQMIHLDQRFQHNDSGFSLGSRFAERLGITGDDQLRRLRALTAEQLYELARADREIGNQYPVIDGHVLPESTFSTFAAGRQADVPMMIGSNADEGTLIRPVLDALMVDFRHLPAPASGVQPEMANAFGDDMGRLAELYPGLTTGNHQAEVDFMGDHMFGARAYYYARHHQATGHPTYLYHFARTPKSTKQTAGAYHAAELPFVHGSKVPIFPMTAGDKALSAEMIGFWTDFAKTGNPNGPAAKIGFPRFDVDDPRWLRFDHTMQSEPVTRREQYEIFNARTDRLVAQMAALTG